jgi:hypothetical protein
MKPVAWMHLPWPNNGLNPVVTLSPNREPSLYGAAVPLYTQSDDPLLRRCHEEFQSFESGTGGLYQGEFKEIIAALQERLGGKK